MAPSFRYLGNFMVAHKKKILRSLCKDKRQLLFKRHPDAGSKISDHFLEWLFLPKGTIVGGYWPIGHELDLRPLLHNLHHHGFTCGLPCIEDKSICFREWAPSLSLVKGKWQTLEPPNTSHVLQPHLVLIPLLAFDSKGNRLGYGQGHFDRYLSHHKVISIGVGFREQEVKSLPTQPHDIPLDFILTEDGLLSISHSPHFTK